jgi:hypothetical protein
MLAALESDIVRGLRAGVVDTPSNGVVSSGWWGRGGVCAAGLGKVKSSESALLISTVGRRRLCRRSREGYGGGGSCGTFRVPSVSIATGGSGDMARRRGWEPQS